MFGNSSQGNPSAALRDRPERWWGPGWALYNGTTRVPSHLPQLRAHRDWMSRLSAAPSKRDAEHFREEVARLDTVIRHLEESDGQPV